MTRAPAARAVAAAALLPALGPPRRASSTTLASGAGGLVAGSLVTLVTTGTPGSQDENAPEGTPTASTASGLSDLSSARTIRLTDTGSPLAGRAARSTGAATRRASLTEAFTAVRLPASATITTGAETNSFAAAASATVSAAPVRIETADAGVLVRARTGP